MALHILQGLSPADQVRQSAGTDFAQMLGTGLQQLANNKMQELQRAQTAIGLQGLQGFAPEQAQALSNLPPELLKEAIKNVVPSKQEKLSARKEYTQQFAPKYEGLKRVRDAYEALDRQVEDAKEFGLIGGFKGHFAPSWLDANSEIFDKTAAEALNLSTETLKGLPTKIRVQFLEKAKPSLKHSYKANKKIIKDKISEVDNALKDLEETYGVNPYVAQQLQKNQSSQPQQSSPPPSTRRRNKKTGVIEVYDSATMTWNPEKKGMENG